MGGENRFAPECKAAGKPVVLNGVGLCEWGLFKIDLYYAALYLEQKTASPKEIVQSDQVKRLELRFVRNLSKSQLVKAYTAAMKANAGDDFSDYADALSEFNAMLCDVKKGCSLVTTYTPNAGLTVTLNGEDQGRVKCEKFARKFFELYVGEKPPTKDLKAGLLGEKDTPSG